MPSKKTRKFSEQRLQELQEASDAKDFEKWAVWDQAGARTECAKRSSPIVCSMSISCHKRAAFSPAAPVPANGPTATRLFQLTSALRLSGCVFPMPSGPGMGDEKTLSIPSPSSICVVGSAAAAPISSAPDLEAALNAGGA